MTPKQGYILPLWENTQTQFVYRATALAYCQRENKQGVSHIDGSYYSIHKLKNSIIS